MTADSIDMFTLFNKKSVRNEAQRNSITDGGRRLYEQGTLYCVGNIASSANATSFARVFPEVWLFVSRFLQPSACLIFTFWVGWGSRR
jgi:hypothetical protein